MNRALSVSNCTSDPVAPRTAQRCPAQIRASLADRGRRDAVRASVLGSKSVSTKRLEKSGWAESALSGASTTSAEEVTSSVRTRVPWLTRVTCRTSAQNQVVERMVPPPRRVGGDQNDGSDAST